MGKVAAAACLCASFQGIQLALVVGICGAAPFGRQQSEDIILGDVVISEGLLQYDLGRQFLSNRFVRKDTPRDNLPRPGPRIRAALDKLQTEQGRSWLQNITPENLEILRQTLGDVVKYPGRTEDRLFKSAYRHKHHNPLECAICANDDGRDDVCDKAIEMSCQQLNCDERELVLRARTIHSSNPIIHFGLVASGDIVMKSGEDRDDIAARDGVIAFEMEGAGVWNNFPSSLVIKGVCDYADNHKNKRWQGYAAATAAAVTKGFLENWGTGIMHPPAPLHSLDFRTGFISHRIEIEKKEIQIGYQGHVSGLWPTSSFETGKRASRQEWKRFLNNSKWNGKCSPAHLMNCGTPLSAPQKTRTRAKSSVFSMRSTNAKIAEGLSSHKHLRKLYGTRTGFNLKFLITSRPYGGIRRGFQPLEIPGLPVIHLSGESDVEMEKISREIDVFIHARVKNIGAQLKLRSDQQELLLQELMRVPNRTYLWVYLTLDLIESDINIDKTEIVKATSHLPKTVDEAYEKILSKSHNFDEAKRLLHIIVAAERPLTLKEMDVALALRENHRSYGDFDFRSEERFRENVRDLCGLFVTIIDLKICLLHQTAKEFLVQNNLANDPKSLQGNFKWKYSLRPQESHRILAEICIWHLLSGEFETHPLNANTSISHYVDGHVFLDYSANHWTVHFKKSHIEADAVIQSLLRICDASSNSCMTWFRIYWTSTDFPENFTTLMIASYFGLEAVVKHLLEVGGIDLNSKDGIYERSAISWAAGNGFDVIVKLLIKGRRISLNGIKLPFRKGAKVDSADRYGRTSLSYASENGHIDTVSLLLMAGARLTTDEIGGTPVSYAICNGHDVVLEMLQGP
ncbi:hypothetical protein V8E54_014333 [Elaphomyces granulatus]